MAFLEINHLHKSFVSPDGKKVPVVNVEEFTLDAGKQLALRGTSGSGKTTLCNLVAAFYNSTNGEILLDGIPLQDINLNSYRTRISYQPE